MDTYAQTLDWLLKSEHPSLRVIIRRDLLHEVPTPQEQAALVDGRSPIRDILNQMIDKTYWIRPNHFYSPKYMASHWSLLLLQEYGCPAELPEVQRACAYLLQGCQRWLDKGMLNLTQDHCMACFFGNVLRYSLAFGFQEHSTVKEILTVLSHTKNGKEWTCEYNYDSPCIWGAVRTLWGYGLLPQDRITPAIQTSMASAVDFICHSTNMLQFINLAPAVKQHSLWDKIHFPLYYQSDRLFTLRVLAEHGQAKHALLRPAIAWLESKRKKNGRWHGSNPYKSRSWPYGFNSEDTDRWVTLQALCVLNAVEEG